ncbi:Exosome component 10 [Conglomerata obtusa]
MEKNDECICKNFDDNKNTPNSAKDMKMKDGLIVKNYLAFELIENEETMDKVLDDIEGAVLIRLYKHTYRTLKGFTCFILLVTNNHNYIIDTLEIRQINNSFFYCKNFKYFHCDKCVKYFIREFGNLGCYTTLDGKSDTFCDGRIRPTTIAFNDVVCLDINSLIDNL